MSTHLWRITWVVQVPMLDGWEEHFFREEAEAREFRAEQQAKLAWDHDLPPLRKIVEHNPVRCRCLF